MIEWNEEMSTGIESLDEQHKVMIATLAALTEALGEGRGRQDVQAILATLHAYVDAHFALEEMCMVRYRCPVAQLNKERHQCFVVELRELKERFDKEGASEDLARAVHHKLGLWFVDHIQGIDTSLRESVVADKVVEA